MTERLRTVIVDDERLARNELRSMLAVFPSIDIIGEADSASAAIELIGKHNPDLLFLDIQMPGDSGFTLLEKTDFRGKVIFVTAFDEYAIRAFEVNAVDYLLKPVNPDRLKKAVERLEREHAEPGAPPRILEYDDSLLLTFNAGMKFLRINSIVAVLAAGDYSEVVTADGKKGLVQKPMGEWEQRLPEKYFCRIHRSSIVNIDAVTRIEESYGDSYKVTVKGLAEPLVMSRRYASRLRKTKT